MIDTLYELINQAGYTHPLHPALTHVPIGGVMVAFFLTLTGVLWKKPTLLNSASHAIAVALVLLFPTVTLGLLDWQHYYAGAWLFPIQMKMGLATLLFFLLSITLFVSRKPNVKPSLMLGLYFLCLLNVTGLGYFGAELVFGGKTAKIEDKKAAQDFQQGQQLFASNCSGCHVNGGNVIYPDMPLHSSRRLESYETFIAFVRDPKLPDGTKGPMPDFTPAKLSDAQARELYKYIVNKIATNKITAQ